MLPGLVDSYNVVRLYLLFTLLGHKSVGCYKLDGTSPLTHELTGSDPILNGIYHAQPGSFISKCAVAVIRAGYRLFAVENNDTCSANATTPQKIEKLKESKKCGPGDANAFQVYNIRGNFKVRAHFSIERKEYLIKIKMIYILQFYASKTELAVC